MKSLQERLFDQFEQIAAQYGCEIVQQPHWANTGQLLALEKHKQYTVVARVHYAIHSGTSEIWFNDADNQRPWFSGADVVAGVGPKIVGHDGTTRRRNPDVFHFEAHDVGGINMAFARWNQLLGEGMS